MTIITDERCTGYHAPGHPERPLRIRATLERLRGQSDLSLTWAEPGDVTEAELLRAHTRAHLERLLEPRDFDLDTAWFPDIAEHARRSAAAALTASRRALQGERTFSLMRPPGHHATRNRAMGFCYLNNAAIAALAARAEGVDRVAVFDFDVHHGNGTEDILLDQPGTLYVSVHQHPCYPGTGTEHRGTNCRNYPMPPATPADEYRRALEQAIDDIRRFQPGLLIVSAGFDAYVRDPLARETLEVEDFHWLGRMIRSLNCPTASLLEGGYSRDLPELIFAYLKGLHDL
ncbi:histone deacetylase family protein [Limisphaera sp. VF-2]|uniref:histone deacetylase family protein n=1 Tax=Limisphaera sp. VF-2 TaxID=3400418 RepID=UPI0017742F4A|nr:histone deacetylase [Limisphaera sp.]